MTTHVQHASLDAQVVDYFERIAPQYDCSRFGDEYGQFIHAEERSILQHWLQDIPPSEVLDFGCGTGRFLDFADHGLDPSAQMLEIAQSKHPGKHLYRGSFLDLDPSVGMPENFRAILSMHVLMHFTPEQNEAFFSWCAEHLAPRGTLVIGVVAKKRRQLRQRIGRYRPQGWHGSSPLSTADVRRLAQGRFRLTGVRGLHLFPNKPWVSRFRPALIPVERRLSATPLADYCRFLLLRLQKIDSSA